MDRRPFFTVTLEAVLLLVIAIFVVLAFFMGWNN